MTINRVDQAEHDRVATRTAEAQTAMMEALGAEFTAQNVPGSVAVVALAEGNLAQAVSFFIGACSMAGLNEQQTLVELDQSIEHHVRETRRRRALALASAAPTPSSRSRRRRTS